MLLLRLAPVLAVFLLTGCARTPVVPVEIQGLAMHLVTVESDAGFDETVARLRAALDATPDLTLAAEFDHAANASEAGLALAPTRVFVFGNPEAGTPLMQARRTVAIDLPQRMLVYEEGGRVLVAYTPPRFLAQRHGLDGQRDRLDAINDTLARLADRAAGR